jgi:hypothetical protein
MTYCSTYIGDLDDPNFHIEQILTINLPRALCAPFPSPREHYNRLFHEWVQARGVACVQTDYNGWVVQARKDELFDYVAFVYGSDPAYMDPERLSASDLRRQARAQLDEITAFIDTLDPDRRYALVAECD